MNARELLAKMSEMRVLVVGDVCLDRWCRYNPALSIESRETGIPRIAVVETERTPGAAGTVAANLKSLGVKEVAVMGAIGDDGFGHELKMALVRKSIYTDYLVVSPRLNTFTYTKLLNAETGKEDLPRVDFINTLDLPEDAEDQVCRMLAGVSGFDLICVSDQAETDRGGVVTEAVRERLAGIASAGERLVWVDSRGRIERFRNAVLKTNADEAAEARSRTGAATLHDVRKQADAPSLFVTHGGNGIQIFDDRGETWIMTRRIDNPVDICGAGDSFTAGAACALAAGATTEEAARLGHLVASVTIMKPGTGFALPDELLEAERWANE
jgi:rfaE bifunctional protein kinase chain/domain